MGGGRLWFHHQVSTKAVREMGGTLGGKQTLINSGLFANRISPCVIFPLCVYLVQRGDVLRRVVHEWLPGSHREWREGHLGVRRKVLHGVRARPYLLPLRQAGLQLHHRELGLPHITGEYRLSCYPTPHHWWVKITLPSYLTSQVSTDYPATLPHITGEYRLPYYPTLYHRWVEITLLPTPDHRWVQITLLPYPTLQVSTDYPTTLPYITGEYRLPYSTSQVGRDYPTTLPNIIGE